MKFLFYPIALYMTSAVFVIAALTGIYNDESCAISGCYEYRKAFLFSGIFLLIYTKIVNKIDPGMRKIRESIGKQFIFIILLFPALAFIVWTCVPLGTKIA